VLSLQSCLVQLATLHHCAQHQQQTDTSKATAVLQVRRKLSIASAGELVKASVLRGLRMTLTCAAMAATHRLTAGLLWGCVMALCILHHY
jgi:ABC-type dipeptide/oligopeptide/nickel transport system permease subunit